MIARKQTLYAFRRDPYQLRLRVRGYDLTGATMSFAIGLYPGEPGTPEILLSNTAVPGASGIRIVAVGNDNGVPWTDLEILQGKPSLDVDLPPAPEVGPGSGGDATFSYDFKWTRPPVGGSGFSSVEETVLFGDFIVKGSVND